MSKKIYIISRKFLPEQVDPKTISDDELSQMVLKDGAIFTQEIFVDLFNSGLIIQDAYLRLINEDQVTETKVIDLRHLVTEMVKNKKATNTICRLTGKPIFSGDPMYVLDTEHYHEDVDMNQVIQEYTEGEYQSTEELYDDDSDYFYFTENYDVEGVVGEILDDTVYYNENGKLHCIHELI